jgi:hypothetical protein
MVLLLGSKSEANGFCDLKKGESNGYFYSSFKGKIHRTAFSENHAFNKLVFMKKNFALLRVLCGLKKS